jgi:uncharacterized protein (DUF983 family)
MGIVGKGNKAYGIFAMKCPRCHTGDLFETSTLSFRKPFDMHKECPHCQQDYEPEPGFYFGSMFISYILTGFFCLFFVGFLILILDWDIMEAFFALIVVIALLFVWIFRFSRSIWIHINVKYRKEFAEK